jgi:ABC-type antimicrobial peptide transport system permease subunit
MSDLVARSLFTRRFVVLLIAGFALFGLLLAALGIYGVIAYAVTLRQQEIGIRMALGAERGDVLRMVLTEAGKMALVGVGIGLVASFLLTRLMSSMLFGVSTHDPLTFLGVAVLLTSVALAACLVPARRATRVDPIVALRCE